MTRKKQDARRRAHSALPVISPVRPTLAKHVPLGREWVCELKLDGFRGVLHIED
jgi:ATP-dependent DNA ligase